MTMYSILILVQTSWRIHDIQKASEKTETENIWILWTPLPRQNVWRRQHTGRIKRGFKTGRVHHRGHTDCNFINYLNAKCCCWGHDLVNERCLQEETYFDDGS